MNPTSSNPSNAACSSEDTTPGLTDLVLKDIREQHPQIHISIYQREYGDEIRLNSVKAGSIFKNRWETFHYELVDEGGWSDPANYSSVKFGKNKRVVDESTHASDPSFFDIVRRDCRAIIR